ncbi:hypothetical protein RB595_008207 [Gaeumannomyces hyphopodioides]
MPIRPNPNSAAANLDHPTTAPTPASGTTTIVTMSSSTATSANGGDVQQTRPAPTTARRQSVAEALAASADLEEALVSPTTTAEHRRDSLSSAADGEGAERARTATKAWVPAMNRRQSWNREEQKHSLHMSSIADVKTGPGFSERGAAQ